MFEDVVICGMEMIGKWCDKKVKSGEGIEGDKKVKSGEEIEGDKKVKSGEEIEGDKKVKSGEGIEGDKKVKSGEGIDTRGMWDDRTMQESSEAKLDTKTCSIGEKMHPGIRS